MKFVFLTELNITFLTNTSILVIHHGLYVCSDFIRIRFQLLWPQHASQRRRYVSIVRKSQRLIRVSLSLLSIAATLAHLFHLDFSLSSNCVCQKLQLHSLVLCQVFSLLFLSDALLHLKYSSL